MPERFHFFWSGPFSQWAPSPFVIDMLRYNCAEQYMMAEKARLFDDVEMELAIMATTDPAEQKALGRSVRGFDSAVWDEHARAIVTRGTRAKFEQHESSRVALLATRGRTLVEASPHDRVWGIGLRRDDPRAQKRTTWRGKNWLGEILTTVRDEILGDRPGR